MRAVGITVEYNPFHNGHSHHAKEAKHHAQADVVVAVMSGHFVQRGEPAIVDKWTRTTMALQNGVDIVIELPYVFSTAVAPRFASGAIALLDAMQCSAFAFGNEQGEAKQFYHTLALLKEHQQHYQALIHQAVKQGLSYPRAMAYAFTSITKQQDVIDLTMPNNILGFHYIEAAVAQNSTMQALTIPRIASAYHDASFTHESIASATAIRKALFTGQSIENFVPPTSAALLRQKTKVTWDDYYPYLRHTLLQWPPEFIATFADVNEGIEFALWRAAKKATTFNDFITLVTSKRYTTARIQRMLTHILVGVTQKERDACVAPSYIRLLGMTSAGQAYLRTVKKQLTLPLISRVGKQQDPMLALDCKATQIYQLATSQHYNDFTAPPIII